MTTDTELLASYLERRDERAFGELVRRHLGLVYSAALRRTGGRVHLAEEISQKVFCDLARKASSLVRHPALTGWLYRTTRYAAIDAARAELHREKLAQSLAAMPDLTSPPDALIDWEKLRPVLDESMDQLGEREREIMLLRFFEGLSFAELGARFSLSENAARMRTERALDKLRRHLSKRGVVSSSSALSLVLANSSLAAAPSGLAAGVTASALATVPASGIAAATTSFLFMSKLTLPAVCAVFAAGLTAIIWKSVTHGARPDDLAAIRAENTRLAAAASGAEKESPKGVAEKVSAETAAVEPVTSQSQGGNPAAAKSPTADAPAKTNGAVLSAVTARGHSNHGQATPRAAMMSFAWAGDICDPEEMGKLLYFDPPVREKALAVLATMPESIRAQYPTPERLYGLFTAAQCLEAPPPGADVIERAMATGTEVELRTGRVAIGQAGNPRSAREFQLTPEGWKYVMPEASISAGPKILKSGTFERLKKR